MIYKRLTKRDELGNVQYATHLKADYIGELYEEVNKKDREILYRLAELEDKIENAQKVEIYYKPPFETKYAIIEYYARQGKPLKVAEYNIYGEELKTDKQLICWEYLSSTNFSVIENGFNTKSEAEQKLKEKQNENN